MIKYKDIFWSKIKLYLSYFVAFFNNDSILFKAYLNNCIIKKLDSRLIILIKYNKSTFFVNNSY